MQHRTIKIPEDIKLSDLERITNILNSKLEGHAIQQLKTEMFQEIYGDMVREKMVLQRIMGVLLNYSREQIHLDGTVNILNQPEFHDVDKLRLLLTSLEEKSMVKQLLTGHSGTGLAIKIGGENKQQGIDQCSIITATYHIDGEAAGTIGLLGPTRMTYSKAIALVQLVTGKLSLVLKDYY